MKIFKKFSGFFRRKWGENYDKKEKDKDVILILVIVHIWVLLVIGLLAQEHLSKLEKDEFGKGPVKKIYGKIYGKTNVRKDKCSVNEGYDCVVTCKGLDLNKQDDVDALYDGLEKAKKAQECKLTLNSVTFYQYSLQENWITPDPSRHVNITKLEISEGQLTNITYNSFACLPNLNTLTIYKTRITELTKNSFINMPELRTLELRANPNLTNIEYGFLQNFKLQTLQIQELPIIGDLAVEFLWNFTGEKNYKFLSSLDLSYNNIGYFPKKILSYYSSNLVQLVISDSNVTEFENGSFSIMPKNGKIVVDRNKLKRFPEDEYRSVVENIGTFYVKDNKLICDCDMEWLQTFVINEKNGNFGDFSTTICDQPEEVPFLEADMCSGTSSTTDATTDETKWSTLPTMETTTDDGNENETGGTSGEITTEAPDILINCTSYGNGRSRRSVSFPQFRVTKRDEITLHLTPRTENLYVRENERDLTIKFQNNQTTKNPLYWKDENYQQIIDSDIKCLTDIRKTNISISKKDVIPDTDYVFCLFNATNAQINILNCKAYKSDPSDSNKTWLANKMKATAITTITLSALVLIIIGALVFYLIVRKNPSLIRGSERVIVVKRHNKAQFMVLPRGHSDSTGSSKYALTDSVDESMGGDSLSTVSYISAIQPTPLEIFRYRLQRLQALTYGNGNEEDDGDGTPPPLPPYPIRIYQPQCNGRLPPNVDLLFEYEWYTTTTTTTTS